MCMCVNPATTGSTQEHRVSYMPRKPPFIMHNYMKKRGISIFFVWLFSTVVL